METIALIIGFSIVFGGLSYVVVDMLKRFDGKVHN